MERVVDQDLFGERMVAALSASFGTLAALLAAMGFTVYWHILLCSEPARFGIRMALGAETAQVRLLIMKESWLDGVCWASRWACRCPMDWRASVNRCSCVRAGDPMVYALGLALIALIALAACYIPARRATRVDPLVALRYE